MPDNDFTNEFVALYEATYEIYKRPNDPDPNPIVYEMFYNSVKRFGFEAVKDAFSTHIQNPDNGQWMPKPADIIRVIEGGSKDNSFMAWSTVERAIGSVGSYETVVFDDPITHIVINDMGGWINLCKSQQDELKFRGNEFKIRYQSYMGKTSLPDHPPKLYGICESENTGLEIEFDQKAVLIGDHSKAQLVLDSGKAVKNLELSAPKDLSRLDLKINANEIDI